MMTGAKIILDTGMDAARNGLAGLAGAGWIMSLPQRQATYTGHPAGRGRPCRPADGGAGLVAVTFGSAAAQAPDRVVLPVYWEPVEPDDEFTGQLVGTIILAPAATSGHCALTLTGACQPPPDAWPADRRERTRVELLEACREFITSVARDVTGAAGPGPDQGPPGPVWVW
jgi:hypothetical protein